MSKTILRWIALSEGVSWILLLFFAMPLKYLGDNPLPVKYIGMAHGILFIALVYLIAAAVEKKVIEKKFGVALFVASFVPFGTFFTDKRFKGKK